VLQIMIGWQDMNLHQFITGERFDRRAVNTALWWWVKARRHPSHPAERLWDHAP
jgi:hypothetical protein